MKPNVVAGLDIGTHSIKMMVAKVPEDAGDLEILGLAEQRSAGVRKGAVVNPEEITKQLLFVKQKIEQMSGVRVKEVSCTIGGSHIFVVPSHGIVAVSRADGNISQEDVDRVLSAAQAFSLRSNTEILDISPQQFIVDGAAGVKEPIGMRGIRLEADVLAICCFTPYRKNLNQAVLAADLEIVDTVPSSLAAGATVLTTQDKELGVALVDIGAGTTGLAVYAEGDLIHTAVFPIGSDNITNDIAIGVRCDHDVAELIKTEFGTCMGSKGKKMEKVQGPDGETVSFAVSFVTHIIEARVKEILQLAGKELKKLGNPPHLNISGGGKQGLLPAGLVFVGGGAKLPRLIDFAKKELKLPSRMGMPHGVLVSESRPELLSVMGLVVSSVDMQERTPGGVFWQGVWSKVRRVFKTFIP
ncbi:MAG: cell division protein FtsA [Candidatus Wildermuthbacteria bacterium]|nr:cell division protein FtsA [Candidatus Wildermuthbacteria bacterium]